MRTSPRSGALPTGGPGRGGDLLTPRADGLTLAVRLTPKAARDGIQGLAAEADGTPVLKATVTAVPENGKANAALVRLLARTWKLPKSSLSVVQGQTDRRKVIHLAGDPAALRERLAGWLETLTP